MSKKPEGIAETEALLRVMVKVPKRELDRQLTKRKKRATRRKK